MRGLQESDEGTQRVLGQRPPLRVQRHSCGFPARAAVPARGVAHVAFLAVKIGVNPRTLPSRFPLGTSMGAFPVAVGVVPERLQRETHAGRRRGIAGDRLLEFCK